MKQVPKIDGRSTRHVRNRRLVYGVGVNDADYNTQETLNGVKVWCKFAATWRDMLERAYSKKFHVKYPSYIGTTVCNEWLTFSKFKLWMEKQDWKGKQLDKDLLGDGFTYSPEFCRFISSQANSIFSVGTRTESRELPVGVIIKGGRYCAYCRDSGVLRHLGLYDTPLEAHRAWQLFKRYQIQRLIKVESLSEIVDALQRRIDKLNLNIVSRTYTEKLGE